jgi:hypothetical protein
MEKIRKNMLVLFPGDTSKGYNPPEIGITKKKIEKGKWEVQVPDVFYVSLRPAISSCTFKTFEQEKLIPLVQFTPQETMLPWKKIIFLKKKEIKERLKHVKFPTDVSVPTIIKPLP